MNLSASALLQMIRDRTAEALLQSVRDLGLQPRMPVVEITEHEHVSDIQALSEAVQQVHAAGVMLALDDFGDGRSSLRLWSELQPDIVKIDKYFTADLSRHAKKLQTLRALMHIAEVFGSTLVAEGIETADDLRVVRDLGIGLGQGYFMGRPLPMPRVEIEPEAASVLRDQRVSVMPTMRTASVSGRLREIQTISAPSATSRTTHDELMRLFEASPGLHAVAIVDDAVPLGLIDRRQFMERYSRRYFKELYGSKPCVTFANLSPRLIEREHDFEDLVGILTSQDQRYQTEGFIVTDNGRYVGLGTGDQLVRTVTESRIEAARHANPLTFLPGNIPITEHIERLLASGGEFVACYGDLSARLGNVGGRCHAGPARQVARERALSQAQGFTHRHVHGFADLRECDVGAQVVGPEEFRKRRSVLGVAAGTAQQARQTSIGVVHQLLNSGRDAVEAPAFARLIERMCPVALLHHAPEDRGGQIGQVRQHQYADPLDAFLKKRQAEVVMVDDVVPAAWPEHGGKPVRLKQITSGLLREAGPFGAL